MIHDPHREAWESATSKDYFKRPGLNPKKCGSQSPESVYLGVGIALTEWERVEENVARLFGYLVSTPGTYSSPAAAKAYGSIESSSARVNMVRAAAEVFFGDHYKNPKIKKPLSSLLDAHTDASHRRNEIAHGVALNLTVNSTPLGCFLVAPDYHTDRNTGWLNSNPEDQWTSATRSKYRYNHADILQMARRFSELSFAAMYYLYDIQPYRPEDQTLALPAGQIFPPNNVVRLLLEQANDKQQSTKLEPTVKHPRHRRRGQASSVKSA